MPLDGIPQRHQPIVRTATKTDVNELLRTGTLREGLQPDQYPYASNIADVAVCTSRGSGVSGLAVRAAVLDLDGLNGLATKIASRFPRPRMRGDRGAGRTRGYW
jgi:hypothetical protein